MLSPWSNLPDFPEIFLPPVEENRSFPGKRNIQCELKIGFSDGDRSWRRKTSG
jgi:hypothetical protein